MQKHVNLVDLVKSFPTNIYLQNLASTQKRTSPIKFDHLSEKSEKGSISNLSTKVPTAGAGARRALSPPRVSSVGQYEKPGATAGPRPLPLFVFRTSQQTIPLRLFQLFRVVDPSDDPSAQWAQLVQLLLGAENCREASQLILRLSG